jgi:hypothetical protein
VQQRSRFLRICRKAQQKLIPVTRNVSMIGLSSHELPWIRRLIALLRHPDPTVAELTRQALLYLSNAPKNTEPQGPPPPTPCKKVSCYIAGSD